jgi:hypothetical protein
MVVGLISESVPFRRGLPQDGYAGT